MASTNYTLTRTAIRLNGKEGVVVNPAGTDLGADGVRYIVDHDNILTKEEALLGLEVIKTKIQESPVWPPV